MTGDENQVEAACFLLAHGADPLNLAVEGGLRQITRDTEMERLQKWRVPPMH